MEQSLETGLGLGLRMPPPRLEEEHHVREDFATSGGIKPLHRGTALTDSYAVAPAQGLRVRMNPVSHTEKPISGDFKAVRMDLGASLESDVEQERQNIYDHGVRASGHWLSSPMQAVSGGNDLYGMGDGVSELEQLEPRNLSISSDLCAIAKSTLSSVKEASSGTTHEPARQIHGQVDDNVVELIQLKEPKSRPVSDPRISTPWFKDLSQFGQRSPLACLATPQAITPPPEGNLGSDLVGSLKRKEDMACPRCMLPPSSSSSSQLKLETIKGIDSVNASGIYSRTGDALKPSNSLQIPSFTRSRSNSQSSRKRQKLHDGTGNDSDDDTSGRPPVKKDGSCDSEHGPQQFFACPYFKKNPIKHLGCFMRFRLKRVKDVKQHLNRKHSLPDHYCPICWMTFENQLRLDSHIRESSCVSAPKPEAYNDAMTADQKRAISKRTDSGVSEWAHWFNTWKILFGTNDQPSSPFLKPTEMEELISTVRWFWKEHNPSIVSSILSSHLSTSGPGIALPSVNNTEEDERNSLSDAVTLTDTMDLLLDRVEDAIQSLGQNEQPSPPSCTWPPSPLLSESNFSVSSDFFPTNTQHPIIAVTDESTPLSAGSCVVKTDDSSPTDLSQVEATPIYPPELDHHEVLTEDFDQIGNGPMSSKDEAMFSNISSLRTE